MVPKIGFVLGSFNRPEQTLFLCRKLSDMFGGPPIAIHNDYSQCSIDTSAFPSNVQFVKNWNKTAWGEIGVVHSILRAYELLYSMRGGSPEWFVWLSTTDYPIKTADRILSDFENASVDAFMDLRAIHDYGGIYENRPLGEDPFNQPRYHQGAFNRYVAIPLLPMATARQYRVPHELFCCNWKWLIRLLTPFGDDLRCYAGSSWLSGNRRVAELFLTDDERRRKLLAHYDGRSIPEESFWHTLVGNTPEIRVSPDNLRYTDWKGCFAHPRTLGRADLPALLNSPAHFARKFDFDPAFFAEIDRAVELREEEQQAALREA